MSVGDLDETSVFVSHTSTSSDLELVSRVEAACRSNGLTPIVLARDFESSSISEKVMCAIRECDYFLVILSAEGAKAPWVNNEVALAIAAGKPVVPLLEEGVHPPGLISEREQCRYKPSEFDAALSKGIRFISTHIAEHRALFRLQVTQSVEGEDQVSVMRVLDVTHVHPDGSSHQMDRTEVASAREGSRTCGVSGRPYILHVVRKRLGVWNDEFVIVLGLENLGIRVENDLYIVPHELVRKR